MLKTICWALKSGGCRFTRSPVEETGEARRRSTSEGHKLLHDGKTERPTKLQKITNKSAALALAAVLIGGLLASSPGTVYGHGTNVHRIVFHVDDSDPKRQNMTLNNVENVNKYYKSRGMKVQIEVVAYGPGLHMLRADTSKVKSRIEAMSLELDNVAFSACGNTKRKMTKKAGKPIPIMPKAKYVPSGVVRLIELQEDGWQYVRP